MIEFIVAPILSLFSPRFYQRVFQYSLARGFLYLAYLSLLGSSAFLLIVTLKWVPTVDNFAVWFAHEMPEITVTGGTLSSQVKQPYVITHPKFGKIFILDTNKEKIDQKEMREAFVYVVKHLVYVSNPFQKETKVFDLSEKASGASQSPVTITGNDATKFYKKMKPIFLSILFGFTFLFMLIWKLIAAIGYSLIAMVLNLFREERFSYEKLLNVSIFAMTAVTLIQFLNALITSIHAPVPLWVALVLTTCYLGLAILFVSPPEKSID